jgi:LysM repeat protein
MSIYPIRLWRRWIVTALAALLLFLSAAYAVPANAQGIPGCPIRITMFDTLLARALPTFSSSLTTTLVAGDVVCLVGRNSAATWVQMALPAPTSTSLGWAPASAFTTTVPITVLPVTESGTPTAPPPPVTPPTSAQTYVVRAGDTLFGIALRYGVTLTALAQANNVLPPAYVIYIGQVLVIPGSSSTTPPVGYSQYVVKAGDYLVKIARLYNLYWGTLATVNGIQYPYVIYPGQVLLIPPVS